MGRPKSENQNKIRLIQESLKELKDRYIQGRISGRDYHALKRDASKRITELRYGKV